MQSFFAGLLAVGGCGRKRNGSGGEPLVLMARKAKSNKGPHLGTGRMEGLHHPNTYGRMSAPTE